jgi:hypothetical protein
VPTFLLVLADDEAETQQPPSGTPQEQLGGAAPALYEEIWLGHYFCNNASSPQDESQQDRQHSLFHQWTLGGSIPRIEETTKL